MICQKDENDRQIIITTTMFSNKKKYIEIAWIVSESVLGVAIHGWIAVCTRKSKYKGSGAIMTVE